MFIKKQHNKAKTTHILTITFFYAIFFTNIANAAVKTTHPRIWIDSTIKTRLESYVSSNTTEWQALKAYCDTNSGKNLYGGYQGSQWSYLVRNYGLCFQVTGSQVYGNEGVKYLIALLRDKNTYGDGLGGKNVIQVDSGWVARTFGIGAAIGRDWLSGATDLTPALIAETIKRLKDWNSWYDNNGYSRNDPLDNYFAGYINYATTSTAKSRHLLVNLKPDTKYSIKIDGSSTAFPNGGTSSSNGVLMFEYAATGEHSYSVSVLETAVPPAPTGFMIRRRGLNNRIANKE